ncbi:MAG: toll/interleukin-1 receptor domain-containing protein [Anaerolineales bacterium]|nr:toll/interleukin-1 receptor domain-containing protein [Anaerolineales bacterium]
MTTNRPLKVFLCHSSNDKPAVRELYQRLRVEPWIQPWLDEEELFPGMDWNIEIEKAIEETDVIIVCLSKGSTTKEGYVQREIRTALDYADYKPEGTLYIIPVRLEECEPPRRLRAWQYADYFEGQRERAFERLLVSLRRRADSLGIQFVVSDSEIDINEKSTNSLSEQSEWLVPVSNAATATDILESSQEDHLYCTNAMGLTLFNSLEDALESKNATNAILNLASLFQYIENYPPDNLEKNFNVSAFSKVGASLEELFEVRGGRALALRVGRAMFSDMIRRFGFFTGGLNLTIAALPLQAKLKIGLPALAKMFTQMSNQKITVQENATEWIWTIDKCPYCLERTGLDKCVCFMAVGFLQESLKWISNGQEFRVAEFRCKATGDYDCAFSIQKNPIA